MGSTSRTTGEAKPQQPAPANVELDVPEDEDSDQLSGGASKLKVPEGEGKVPKAKAKAAAKGKAKAHAKGKAKAKGKPQAAKTGHGNPKQDPAGGIVEGQGGQEEGMPAKKKRCRAADFNIPIPTFEDYSVPNLMYIQFRVHVSTN